MFLFVGLEVPHRLQAAVETAPGILGSALGISAAVIAARFVWIFPGAYLPLWLLPRLRRFEGGYPDPRAVLLGAWCGVRGAVSLAAALSIPLALRDGTAFPGRAEIVTCTLVVILVTLIGQGLTLLPLVRRLREAMADQLASLKTDDAVVRSEALRRLDVAREVRRAVYQAKTGALLSLRDRGGLNDRAHQELQLDLDRENADVRTG